MDTNAHWNAWNYLIVDIVEICSQVCSCLAFEHHLTTPWDKFIPLWLPEMYVAGSSCSCTAHPIVDSFSMIDGSGHVSNLVGTLQVSNKASPNPFFYTLKAVAANTIRYGYACANVFIGNIFTLIYIYPQMFCILCHFFSHHMTLLCYSCSIWNNHQTV